jgi:hypothetical protein
MAESNFNLRGIPSEVMTLLKKEAKKLGISVNALVLKMILRELGLSVEKPIHHDLDYLAGTWSPNDEKAFKENTQSFEQNN